MMTVNLSKSLLVKNVKFTYCIYMRQVIPDLRLKQEVTLEHISVLQEQFGYLLDKAYPGEGNADALINFNPQLIHEQLLTLFTREALATLYQTEMGKGVLMGAFFQKYVGEAYEEEV